MSHESSAGKSLLITQAIGYSVDIQPDRETSPQRDLRNNLKIIREEVEAVCRGYGWELINFHTDPNSVLGNPRARKNIEELEMNGLLAALKELRPGRVLLTGVDGISWDNYQKDSFLRAVAASGGEWQRSGILLAALKDPSPPGEPLFGNKDTPIMFDVSYHGVSDNSARCFFCDGYLDSMWAIGRTRHVEQLGWTCHKCLKQTAEDLYKHIDLARFPQLRNVRILMPLEFDYERASDLHMKNQVMAEEGDRLMDNAVPEDRHLPGPPDDGSRKY